MASAMHDIPLLIHFFAEAGPTPYTPVNVCKTEISQATKHTPIKRPFVQDYPGEPVPER